MTDRKAAVERHNPCYRDLKIKAPLSVGNGAFCYTADFTGFQTFFSEYSAADDAFPLCTMAEWGWHSYPLSKEEEAELRLTPYDTYGRTVNYATCEKGQEELFKKIRVNAHKFHLGKTVLEYSKKNLSLDNCKPVRQFLSLWEGILYSEFLIENIIVKTETFAHPNEDSVYFRVFSPLLSEKKLQITLVFPYGSHKKTGADFNAAGLHSTRLLIDNNDQGADTKVYESVCIERILDDTLYNVTIKGNGFYVSAKEEKHTVKLLPHSDYMEFNIKFEPVSIPSFARAAIAFGSDNQNDSYERARAKCKLYREHQWQSGGFMDFSGSKDSRASELERRIILSQYLISIQSKGSIPPAETGLTCNSWYGKFHLEMLFWHHAHWPLWSRLEDIKKSLEYYKKILPAAKEIASSQGYSGARWPKMCDPAGRNTPSSVAVLLIWQQGHPVMLAELIQRAEKSDEFLREYREVILETTEFMKSFVHWEESNSSSPTAAGRYVLGPPYIPVQERHDPKIVLNAAFELEYFRWCFRKADEWLLRLGENSRYGEIAEKLSLPPVKDGLYMAHENCPDTFNKLPFFTDHPSMLAMYGVLNSEKIDRNIMSATLDKVLSVWIKESFYGWDFPMIAMTACRLGRYRDAVDILLMDSQKNTWIDNGHNKQAGDNNLPLYLPGNGALLLAAAMLAAGYGDKTGSSFPEGFTVNAEGILPYI
ncbi:MAG: hypothetical protein FWC03_00105 [Treponema sp.]|nr:hypothetical protein [Treponema sp.]